MVSSASRSGGDFLDKKSGVAKSRQKLPTIRDVLIVEDETFDADRLKATLHLILGYDIEIRRAATLGSALDAVIARQPEIVFLDDVLKPSDNASHTIPFLRHAGFTGPIVVISGQVTRQRRATLIEAGAIDVIHKDDVDSVRVGEALQRVLGGDTAVEPAKK
jgi:DNA-binding NarL/FixJ family response regulator